MLGQVSREEDRAVTAGRTAGGARAAVPQRFGSSSSPSRAYVDREQRLRARMRSGAAVGDGVGSGAGAAGAGAGDVLIVGEDEEHGSRCELAVHGALSLPSRQGVTEDEIVIEVHSGKYLPVPGGLHPVDPGVREIMDAAGDQGDLRHGRSLAKAVSGFHLKL